MRISDWSSDVCSSDLIGVFRPLLHPSYIPQPNEISAVPSPDDQFTELLGGGVRPVDAQRDVLVHCLDTPGRKFHILTAKRVLHVIRGQRSEEHTSELQSLMRTSYAVFCLKKKQSGGYKTIISLDMLVKKHKDITSAIERR